MKRTVIVRDSDLTKLIKIVKSGLFDSIESEQLTYQDLQNIILVDVLRDPDSVKIPEQRVLPNLVENIMYVERELYDRRYLNWELTYDYPAGQIYVRSSINQPRQSLHRVTLRYNDE